MRVTKIIKWTVSIVLLIALLLCATVPAFAAKDEEYISELRLVYAEDYNEAKEIIAEGEFKEYKVLNENLNENSDEIGVWLAYKTTTNIEEAITDLAVMQMNGGYSDGNYQEMIKQSYDDYVAMGQIYLDAINYFVEAYDAGDYLAESAFRQLNFYNIVRNGIPKDKIPTFEGERLGDIFYEGIDEYELATIFFQGNVHVLNNVRSLLAMGVSYNEDGKTYLDKVGDAAAQVTEDPTVFIDDMEDLDMYASLIAPSIGVFADMFKELATVEEEFNYKDDDFTDNEIRYLEYYSIAQRMRNVEYLDGKTLYQFCLEYVLDEDDYSALYPLAAALNEGQQAMTKVFHYYDVVRYSASGYSEEAMEDALAPQEEKYGENPFNVYEGVDRSIYYGTFALTSEAERADAMTDENTLADAFFGQDSTLERDVTMFVSGACLFATAFGVLDMSKDAATVVADKVTTKVSDKAMQIVQELADKKSDFVLGSVSSNGAITPTISKMSYDSYANHLINKYFANSTEISTTASFSDKVTFLRDNLDDVADQLSGSARVIARNEYTAIEKMNSNIMNAQQAAGIKTEQPASQAATATASTGAKIFAGVLYVVGGALMLYSAYSIIMTFVNYYHPDYEDVPLSMVDMVKTIDGDRYIKYDVVYNAETNEDGIYEAADLNAFEAKRWNALYYTKSYEAGKPLLADAFVLSNTNNQPKEGYTPVHRFGEQICYDLNKYNFDGDTNIYLSVKQSKNDKYAVAGVPEVVGSMFSVGYVLLAGGIGAAVGIGGTIATQSIIKKKKANNKA